MRRKSAITVKKNARSKTKLGLPDLDQAKTAVRRQAYEAADSELLSPDIHGAPHNFLLLQSDQNLEYYCWPRNSLNEQNQG